MATSTIPSCKAAIVEILLARVALAEVHIDRSMPTKDEDIGQDGIYVGEASNDEDWNQLGGHQRGEEYWINITVYVEDWGDDPVTAEQRVFEIWGEVTQGLRDDLRAPQTGGTSLLRTAGVLQYGRITYRQVAAPAGNEKWGARIDGRVLFTAHTL